MMMNEILCCLREKLDKTSPAKNPNDNRSSGSSNAGLAVPNHDPSEAEIEARRPRVSR
jgi:hypothetical protein